MKALFFAVGAVLVLCIGFALGRLNRWNPEAEVAVPKASLQGAPTAEAPGALSSEDADCQQALARARAQLASWEAKAKVQGWMLGHVQAALHEYDKGENDPVLWDEDAPLSFRPEAFERVISAAVDQASAGIQYAGASCNEAPCVAMLRLRDEEDEGSKWLKKFQATPSWSETYDNMIGLWTTTVDCQDGRKERIALVAKRWPDMSDALKLHMDKRLPQREKAIIKGWTCRGDASR